MRTFASDNFSAVDPAVMAYLNEINEGHGQSYEGDEVTKQVQAEFTKIFGDCRVVFVPTGTGANVLALKLMLKHSYEAVVTSQVSHVFEEETGALSAATGAQIFPLSHTDGKIMVDDLAREVAMRKALEFHSALPRVVSIANSNEYGVLYRPAEIKAIADYCHAHELLLHMDGCRLANVAAALGVGLRELTRDAGVDVLCFGGAKNGLMNSEAVVIFNDQGHSVLHAQKQAMQLVSKMRYMSAQFIPYLRDGLWLKNALHANELAASLEIGLLELQPDLQLTRPRNTNQLFFVMPDDMKRRARQQFSFYDWNNPGEVRLVTAWDNTEADVEGFLALCKAT